MTISAFMAVVFFLSVLIALSIFAYLETKQEVFIAFFGYILLCLVLVTINFDFESAYTKQAFWNTVTESSNKETDRIIAEKSKVFPKQFINRDIIYKSVEEKIYKQVDEQFRKANEI